MAHASNEVNLNETLSLYQELGTAVAVAKKLKLPESTIRSRINRAKRMGLMNGTKGDAPKKPGRSLQDFRQEHDKDFIVPKKIKDGLKILGGGWEYEVAFAKLCGLSLSDLGNYRDAFSEHVVSLKRDGKRAWAGNTATAAKMREML